MTFSVDSIRSKPYGAYSFSNDRWSGAETQKLRGLLAEQQTEKARSVGAVVGSGGLPFILGYLGIPRLAVLDRSPEVIQGVASRIEVVKTSSSWDEYRRYIAGNLSTSEALKFESEFRTASESGLMGNFEAAREASLTTEIMSLPGDIVNTLPQLAEECRGESKVISFANMTNVAHALQIGGYGTAFRHGNLALARLLVDMPLAEDVVIVESATDALRPCVRTAEDYFTAIENDAESFAQ